MKCDIILTGVGGQGVLAVSNVIAKAATLENYYVKQSEVHGMAQRGGSVVSHLRISDDIIYSDLIPKGDADVILGMEPLESLRYVDYLSHKGSIITSGNSVINIKNYPEIDVILNSLKKYSSIVVDDNKIAMTSGNPKSKNMVMVGALSKKLQINDESILSAIESLFIKKGKEVVKTNINAFHLGKSIR